MRRLLLLLLVVVAAFGLASSSKRSLMSKYRRKAADNLAANIDVLKDTTADLASAAASAATGLMNTVKTVQIDPQTAFIQRMMKGEVHQMDLFNYAMESEGFTTLLQPENAQVLEKILDTLPVMKALPVFKAAKEALDQGLTFTPQEMVDIYKQGMKDAVGAMQAVFDRTIDPDSMADILEEMNTDTSNPDLVFNMQKAQQGEEGAVKAVADEFNKRAFPSLDASVLDELSDYSNIEAMMEQLWASEEVMRQIDSDEVMGWTMRNPVDFRAAVREGGYMGTATQQA